MTRRHALEAFVDEARAVSCESEAVRRGWKLRRTGAELIGPCPACGGVDRFGINRVKNVFSCRKSGAGGDAIALVQYVDGVDFLSACSVLTGRPIPDREAAGPDAAMLEARAKERAAAEAKRELDATAFREQARAKAFETWKRGQPAARTLAEAYLGGRGLPLLPVRFIGDHAYWHGGERPRLLHSGPAMLAAVLRPDGRFGAVHVTWIDPARPGRKATIVVPETGEPLPAKKVHGAKKGGAIRLADPLGAARLVVGEGIETTASVMVAEARPDTAYWVGVDLGNLGGRAAETLVHPSLTRADKAGRVRRARYPGPVPDMTDDEAFVPPGRFRQVVFLGDGDSDRVTTEAALMRGARRAMRLNHALEACIAWAPAGADFNDVLTATAATAETVTGDA